MKALTNAQAVQLTAGGAGCYELWYRSLAATWDGNIKKGSRLGRRLERRSRNGDCPNMFYEFLGMKNPNEL